MKASPLSLLLLVALGVTGCDSRSGVEAEPKTNSVAAAPVAPPLPSSHHTEAAPGFKIVCDGNGVFSGQMIGGRYVFAAVNTSLARTNINDAIEDTWTVMVGVDNNVGGTQTDGNSWNTLYQDGNEDFVNGPNALISFPAFGSDVTPSPYILPAALRWWQLSAGISIPVTANPKPEGGSNEHR